MLYYETIWTMQFEQLESADCKISVIQVSFYFHKFQ